MLTEWFKAGFKTILNKTNNANSLVKPPLPSKRTVRSMIKPTDKKKNILQYKAAWRGETVSLKSKD